MGINPKKCPKPFDGWCVVPITKVQGPLAHCMCSVPNFLQSGNNLYCMLSPVGIWGGRLSCWHPMWKGYWPDLNYILVSFYTCHKSCSARRALSLARSCKWGEMIVGLCQGTSLYPRSSNTIRTMWGWGWGWKCLRRIWKEREEWEDGSFFSYLYFVQAIPIYSAALLGSFP